MTSFLHFSGPKIAKIPPAEKWLRKHWKREVQLVSRDFSKTTYYRLYYHKVSLKNSTAFQIRYTDHERSPFAFWGLFGPNLPLFDTKSTF